MSTLFCSAAAASSGLANVSFSAPEEATVKLPDKEATERIGSSETSLTMISPFVDLNVPSAVSFLPAARSIAAFFSSTTDVVSVETSPSILVFPLWKLRLALFTPITSPVRLLFCPENVTCVCMTGCTFSPLVMSVPSTNTATDPSAPFTLIDVSPLNSALAPPLA